MSTESSLPTIPLTEALGVLRTQLSNAILASQTENIKFVAEQVELEFQVAIEKGGGVNSGFNIGVLQFGGGANLDRSDVHTVKITLKTKNTATGGAVECGGDAPAG